MKFGTKHKKKEAIEDGGFRKKDRQTFKVWGLITLVFIVLDLLVGWLFYNSFKASVIFVPAYLLFAKMAAHWIKERQSRRLKQEFRTWMMLLYSMISAGESLETAIEDSLEELQTMGTEPMMVKELQLMVVKLNMNYSVNRCLDDFSKRAGDEDISDFCEIIKLAREKGGSMRKIVRNSIERINGKIEMECQIQTVIAGKKNEFMIMACIPVGMILYMRMGSPELMRVLYSQLAGRLIMTVSLMVYLIAVYIGIQMTKIKA